MCVVILQLRSNSLSLCLETSLSICLDVVHLQVKKYVNHQVHEAITRIRPLINLWIVSYLLSICSSLLSVRDITLVTARVLLGQVLHQVLRLHPVMAPLCAELMTRLLDLSDL